MTPPTTANSPRSCCARSRPGRTRGGCDSAGRPGARIDTTLESLVLTGEQSNTSLVYGEEAILKLFRRLTPGANPDLEVTSALARIGSAHIAQPFGWIEMELDGTRDDHRHPVRIPPYGERRLVTRADLGAGPLRG